MLGQFCVAIAVDVAIDFDHGGGREGACAGHRRRGWRWSSWPGAAHAQIAEVFSAQVGGHRLDQVAIDEDVDGVLVDPDVRALPAAVGAQADPLHRGDNREEPAGGDDGVELDRTGRRQQHQPAIGAAGFRRWDRFGGILISWRIRLPCEHQGRGLGVGPKQGRRGRHVQ